MTAPEASPLPWHNEPNSPDNFGCMRDANNAVVEIYGTHGYELRERIVTAVNSRANLLAAAKWAVTGIRQDDTPTIAQLRAAIAAAEDQAP